MAADFALRLCGLPCLDLWQMLLPHKPGLIVHEDNQAMMTVVKSGRNPTMRYLKKMHRVSVAWLHQRFKSKVYELVYEVSCRMAADIYTKAFSDPFKWVAVCVLNDTFDPKY